MLPRESESLVTENEKEVGEMGDNGMSYVGCGDNVVAVVVSL